MSVEIRPHCNFGVSPAITESIMYLNEHTIMYPSGTNVVLLNTEANTQQFLCSIQKSRGVTTMALSEPGRVIATAEKSDGDKPFISLFEMESLKRKKTLQTNFILSDRFESLSFSADGKYLAAIGGPPDNLLCVWIWDSKSQVLCKMKFGSSAGSGPIPTLPNSMIKPYYSIAFNSFDNQRFMVYGKDTLRQYYIQSSNLFPYRHMRNEGQLFAWIKCLVWLSEDCLLVGLDCNAVQYYEGGELRQELKVIIPNDTDFMLVQSDDPDEFAVRSLVIHDRGFICACGRGKIHLYEKVDEGTEKYRKLKEIETQHKATKGDFGGFVQDPYIMALALSPSQKVLMCLAERGLIYSCDLLKDYRKDAKSQLTQIGPRVHVKEITCVDISVRKPLIVTSSLDRHLCIWNYVTGRQELYKEFNEWLYSVSLHPDGLYLIVGMEKSLKLMNIFINEIVPLKTYSVKNCRSCRFANGGHYFAVANWNVIEIYSSITLNIVYHLRGHVDRINNLFWSKTDCKIVTVTDDGEMFEWDVSTARKVSENISKNCRYYDTCIEGKSIFVVGSDFVVKEIQESAITKKLSANNIQITRLVITNSSRRMFLGLWSGAIRCLHYPITRMEDGTEIQGHSAPVTGLRVTFDDQFLISVSEDSIVIVWRIIDDELISKSKMESSFSKEVLANPLDLDSKNKLLNQLEYKVEQLKAENHLQLHSRDVKYNENLTKVSLKLKTELDVLKQKNQEMEEESQELHTKYSKHLLELIRKLRGDCSLTEQRIKEKLRVEAEKYQSLKEQGTQTQEAYERELEDKGKKLQNIVYQLLSTIHSINTNPPEPPPNPMAEWENMITELEDDTDMELVSRKENFKDTFARERQAISDLQGEIVNLKRHMNSLSYTTKNQRKLIASKQEAINHLTSDIHGVEQNIHQLKKLLQEKTEALDYRLKVESELREKNQNLEKAKSVLDVKMHSLLKQLEPMTAEIKYLKLQELGKEQEFSEFRKNVNVHRGQIYRGKEKLQTLQDVEYVEKAKVTTAKKKLNRLINDLKNCSSVIHKPRLLKRCIFQVYRNNVVKVSSNPMSNTQLQGMNPQREHLESLISDLKGQMRRNRLKYDNDDKIIMRQNIHLMREINELRRELKENQGITSLLAEAIELDRANPKMSTKEFLDMLVDVTSNAKLVKQVDELKQTLERRMKTIRFLQHQNLQLKTLLQERIQAQQAQTAAEEEERRISPELVATRHVVPTLPSKYTNVRITLSKFNQNMF